MAIKVEKPAFDITYKGFRGLGFYGIEGVGRIEITRDDQPFKIFDCPSYRIWNFATHFNELIDNCLADEKQGRG